MAAPAGRQYAPLDALRVRAHCEDCSSGGAYGRKMQGNWNHGRGALPLPIPRHYAELRGYANHAAV
jgi:hypothetical protein